MGKIQKIGLICLVAARYLASFDNAYAQDASDTGTLIVSEDLVLDPTKQYGPLLITASNITIDGQGATLHGTVTGNEANKRRGIAISAKGQSNVTLKNIKAHHWETGLEIVDGVKWTIENCDFSDNFHDPEFGWGENGRRGGIVLKNVNGSLLRKNRANRVWDACVLVDSSNNVLEDNDFSHTSNTCLKLWNSSNNQVSKNVLSHGIRIKEGEVHARDSTSVLIESGSNDNRFIDNNCTYGGDGIFVRVLNGWCSTGNRFEGNDCSYANNNGFECWAPRNEFVRNKANHCSYGFWLGGSDQTRLEDNEASFNGLKDGNHNSPHLPGNGHAGIVFMFGPSSHIVARGNTCVGNNGAGIALVGDLESRGAKWKAYHWIIEGNHLHENHWGVFAQFADWVQLSNNHFKANSQRDVMLAEGVSRLEMGSESLGDKVQQKPARVELTGPQSVRAGEQIKFTCSSAGTTVDLKYTWDLGDGTTASAAAVEHIYQQPGFYRVGVNATGPAGTELAYRDLYVAADQPELAADATGWDFEVAETLKCTFTVDNLNHVAGANSVRVVLDPYHGFSARVLYPKTRNAGWSLKSKTHLAFWLKAINPNLPGWQSNNPEVTLYENSERKIRLTPKRDQFTDMKYSEARDGWRYFEIPLASHAEWDRQGDELSIVNYLTIGVDSWDSQPLQLWIDGLILR